MAISVSDQNGLLLTIVIASILLLLIWTLFNRTLFNRHEDKPTYLFWTKLNLALDIHVKEALLSLLHNRGNDPSYIGLPEDPGQLFLYLNQLPQKTKKLLNACQKDQSFPSNGKQVDSSKWDVTLITAIIQNCIPELKPLNGWVNIDRGDQSKGAYVIRARRLRNELKHTNCDDINSKDTFDEFWDRITDILNKLGYLDMKKFQEIKTKSSLDIYVEEINKIYEKKRTMEMEQNSREEIEDKTKQKG